MQCEISGPRARSRTQSAMCTGAADCARRAASLLRIWAVWQLSRYLGLQVPQGQSCVSRRDAPPAPRSKMHRRAHGAHIPSPGRSNRGSLCGWGGRAPACLRLAPRCTAPPRFACPRALECAAGRTSAATSAAQPRARQGQEAQRAPTCARRGPWAAAPRPWGRRGEEGRSEEGRSEEGIQRSRHHRSGCRSRVLPSQSPPGGRLLRSAWTPGGARGARVARGRGWRGGRAGTRQHGSFEAAGALCKTPTGGEGGGSAGTKAAPRCRTARQSLSAAASSEGQGPPERAARATRASVDRRHESDVLSPDDEVRPKPA